MRDTRRQIIWYQIDDTEAIARHLEKMAKKGWLLEAVDNLGYRYRRGEPGQVKYTVAFFPEASVFDPGLTEGQETYMDYCQAAGWELAAFYGPVQYFRSVQPDPAPIETDELVKLAAVRRTMRKTYVLSYALLLLLPAITLPLYWQEFCYNPMEFVSRNISLSTALLMAWIAVYGALMLLDYLFWVVRSRRAVVHGGACVKPHTRFRLGISGVMIAVCLAVLLGYFVDSGISGLRVMLLLYLAFYGGTIFLGRRILQSMKRRGIQRGKAKGLYVVFALVMGLAAGLSMPLLFGSLSDAGLIHQVREPVETYTKTRENVSWTVNIFHDNLPVTLEDLGWSVSPEDHCTYEAEISRSPLAVYSRYTQDALSLGSDLPRLHYQIFDARWPWLLEECWDRLIAEERERLDPWPMEMLNPAPWGAEAVYRPKDGNEYFLLYPGRIVTFRLSGDKEPEKLNAIALALKP